VSITLSDGWVGDLYGLDAWLAAMSTVPIALDDRKPETTPSRTRRSARLSDADADTDAFLDDLISATSRGRDAGISADDDDAYGDESDESDEDEDEDEESDVPPATLRRLEQALGIEGVQIHTGRGGGRVYQRAVSFRGIEGTDTARRVGEAITAVLRSMGDVTQVTITLIPLVLDWEMTDLLVWTGEGSSEHVVQVMRTLVAAAPPPPYNPAAGTFTAPTPDVPFTPDSPSTGKSASTNDLDDVFRSSLAMTAESGSDLVNAGSLALIHVIVAQAGGAAAMLKSTLDSLQVDKENTNRALSSAEKRIVAAEAATTQATIVLEQTRTAHAKDLARAAEVHASEMQRANLEHRSAMAELRRDHAEELDRATTERTIADLKRDAESARRRKTITSTGTDDEPDSFGEQAIQAIFSKFMGGTDDSAPAPSEPAPPSQSPLEQLRATSPAKMALGLKLMGKQKREDAFAALVRQDPGLAKEIMGALEDMLIADTDADDASTPDA